MAKVEGSQGIRIFQAGSVVGASNCEAEACIAVCSKQKRKGIPSRPGQTTTGTSRNDKKG